MEINKTAIVGRGSFGNDVWRAYSRKTGAMHEVIAVAQKEGIILTEEDFDNYIKIIRSLDPKGYPSMRQDAIAKRKSELELFAGTIIRIAKKYGVPVPVNQFYYNRINSIENGYEILG